MDLLPSMRPFVSPLIRSQVQFRWMREMLDVIPLGELLLLLSSWCQEHLLLIFKTGKWWFDVICMCMCVISHKGYHKQRKESWWSSWMTACRSEEKEIPALSLFNELLASGIMVVISCRRMNLLYYLFLSLSPLNFIPILLFLLCNFRRVLIDSKKNCFKWATEWNAGEE